MAGKRDSRRHSNTSFCKNVIVVAETSNISKMLEVLSFCDRDTEGLTFFNKDNSAIFSGEKKMQSAFPGCLFLSAKKAEVKEKSF